MTKVSGWIPMLLPKDIAKKLLKDAVPSSIGKRVNQKQVLSVLHKTRKKLLKKNPHAYIDYSAR